MVKKNTYNQADLQVIKQELINNVNYLNSIKLSNLDDEINWNMNMSGMMVPSVTTSIEQKLNAFMTLLKASLEQLRYVVEKEKRIDTMMEANLERLKIYIKRMETYFQDRPPDTLKDRKKKIDKTNSKGVKIELELLVANIPKQLENRAKIFDIILKSQPALNQIENFNIQTQEESKGKSTIPYRMRQDYIDYNKLQDAGNKLSI